MVLFIILVLTFLGGLAQIKRSYDKEYIGAIVMIISGIYLCLHTIGWSLSSYKFNKYVTEREAFVETLEFARKNNSQIELASLAREISVWNRGLAKIKYDNNFFLLEAYIDNRIMTLEPIR